MAVLLSVSEANEVNCERMKFALDEETPVKTCYMKNTTKILKAGSIISLPRDEEMKKLNFRTNKKIFFLPIKISKSFPDLLVLDAGRCSLKKIARESFQGLQNLQKLFLDQNRIEKVPKNTFEDLIELLIIDLSE